MKKYLLILLLFAFGDNAFCQEKMPVRLAAQYKYKIPGLTKMAEFYSGDFQSYQTIFVGIDGVGQLHIYYSSYQDPFSIIRFNLNQLVLKDETKTVYSGQFEKDKEVYQLTMDRKDESIQLTKVSGNLNKPYSVNFKLKYSEPL